MRALIAMTAIATAALLSIPAPSAEAGGLFFRDRAPLAYRGRAPVAAYFAPAPRRYYRAPAVAYFGAPARRGCFFDMFRWRDRRPARTN